MIGTTLSHYRILEKLGEGGMGIVYKARDLRLDRFVALKVLPPAKVADPDRHRRFVQEARAASALNHSGIVSIHDIDEKDGVHFIAMEFVQGKTLTELIGKRSMPVSEAVRIGKQIADALACAHTAGIVHRDLKPANVMVAEGQTVKLLDFGLAKLNAFDTTDAKTQDIPTLAARTAQGTIVGTIAYMSPEQAEGKPVDCRSDVFSFGAVLYEMLTGDAAFARGSATSTLAAILRDEPPAIGGIPHELETIVTRCLRKDPRRRFQSMADVKVSLEDVEEELSSAAGRAAAAVAARRPSWPSWLAASVIGAALLIGGMWLGHRFFPARREISAPVPLTSYAGRCRHPALSPDGRQLAFSWNGEKEDNYDIYVKLIGPGVPLRLTTDQASDSNPAWSPDGTQIAFLRQLEGGRSAVILIPAMGGPERRIAEGSFRGRMTWSRDGSSLIVSYSPTGVSTGFGFGLSVLSIGSGQLRRLRMPAAETLTNDWAPALSPDGRTLAFTRSYGGVVSEICLLRLTTSLEAAGEARRFTQAWTSAGEPAWTPDGKSIVFSVGGNDAASLPSLWIAPVSPQSGKPERLAFAEGGDSPAISPNGRLVYRRRIRDENIWRLRLGGSHPPERLVYSTRRENEPRFSPDGKSFVFHSDQSGSDQVWIARADGTGQHQLTAMSGTVFSSARWSPDGQWLVFVSSLEGQLEIYRTTPEGRTPERLTDNPAVDGAPSYSRDGRWIYFGSNRDGGFQVWKMPAAGGKATRVTKGGGYALLESLDGRALYYAKLEEGRGWSLWSVSSEDGEEKRILPNIAFWEDFDIALSGIYFIDSQRLGAKLMFHSFRDSKDTVLATLEKRSSTGVTVSPAEDAVLFSQFDQDATELILVESFL